MKRLLYLLLLLNFFVTSAVAAGVEFVASAPKAVVAGERFSVVYTINENCNNYPDVKFGAEFKFIFGPAHSVGFSSSTINGVSSSSTKTSFTYTLLATKEGKFTIPSATITSSKGVLTSNALTIEVLPPDKQVPQQGGGSGNRRSAAANGKNTAVISDEDIFILPVLSKTKVYEQEAVMLTYKLYTRYTQFNSFENVNPDFSDFQAQEIDLDNNRREKLEHYKGLNYNTLVLRQFVLFPQKSGELVIPSVEIETSLPVVVDEPSLNDDIMLAMMRGFSPRVVNVKKKLKVPEMKITVEPLPKGKPADFSQGVGDFTLKSEISTTNLRANEAVTVKLTLSGNGNIKTMNVPKINFPEDFEVYDPKTSNDYKIKSNGYSGSKVVEYIAIPRSAGKYEIPPVSFSYFDVKSGSYKTLETEKYTLQVAKGNGSAAPGATIYTNKEAVKQLGSDIRHIKIGDSKQIKRSDILFATKEYMLVYLLSSMLFILFIILQRKRIAANANSLMLRTKRANKYAVRRLRIAKKMLSAGEKAKFYDETLKALWGYASDKMAIPVSELTKDNIEMNLLAKGVNENLVSAFKNLLDECEFARFAPGSTATTRDSIYSQAVEIINKMESSIH